VEVERLRALLDDVRSGALDVDAAIGKLRDLPYEDLGFAKLDHHRAVRTGHPEVVFCPGKTIEQVVAIVERLRQRASKVLATRAEPAVYEALKEQWPDAEYRTPARIAITQGEQPTASAPNTRGTVLVITAGTADIPVAEEAAVTAEEMGSPVERIYDVGVAGLHRILDQREKLFAASALVVVAGMEGALASVVGGLVSRPVVAVPTSIGYGASFQGLAPLLTMLNSCATGVAVMNIDNGFGGGYYAHLVNLT
jgi:NCAIR mutase (PurE)-related protein